MQETQDTLVQSLGREDPLEEEMATHSSILAGRIPWTESLVGYGPQGHNESDMTEHAGDKPGEKQLPTVTLGLPGGSLVKNTPASAGDAGSIPGSGKSPARGNGNPLQYSCWENPMDRGLQFMRWSRAGHN